MLRTLPQCPGCVILTFLNAPASLIPEMACPDSPQPAPLSRSSTAPSLGPLSRGLRGLKKRGGALRRFTTTVLPGQLRAALASPKPRNASKIPQHTGNIPKTPSADRKNAPDLSVMPLNAPSTSLNAPSMPLNAPSMPLSAPSTPLNAPSTPQKAPQALTDPNVLAVPQNTQSSTMSAVPCPAPPRECPKVTPLTPRSLSPPVPRLRTPQLTPAKLQFNAKPQPAPRTIFMLQLGPHLGPVDSQLGPIPVCSLMQPCLGPFTPSKLTPSKLGPSELGPDHHHHIPWVTTPPPYKAPRSLQVDGGGGGGEGKKWIANRSLQRHYPEHCVDPSLSDTELGKISTPHSLLDGECVSVGGSSMTSERAIDVGRVGTWASSFEKLLEDPAGLHTFAEFLKKEYSHENIYFWTACERYKRLTSPDELRSTARQIFERHLYSGAPEPVNVDSQARQDAQDGLHLPNESLFAQAQKQIFNLMKFDSYSRFLKSALYQDCLTQEMRGQPLPYAGDDALDPDLRIGAEDSHVKLKKSRSDADERRRKSLLPWNRKDRSKSKDRGEAEYRRRKKNTLRNTSDSSSLRSDVSGSRTSLNSSDLPLGRRVASRESLTSGDQGSLSGGEGSARCRVVLPDLTNSVVAIKGSETVQEVMGRLLERRGLSYSTFEVYHHKTDKLLNKKEDSSILGGCEVRLEQRVFFQLDLPSQKVVCIKAKPAKTTGEVLKPILQKYGLKIDLLHIHRDGEERPVNLKAPVTDIDGMKLVVQTKEEVKGQVRSAEVGSGQVRSGQVKLDMIVREGMKRRIDEF
ncbi:regulator of G-protein signaling loco-like isoform X2 [Scylla paramamosain]|uniref:regulator of G-protein signaling loco-like isoform X2 n=1 Tax=Scylla paramamosain TaxID=85552 RepID=UPI0030838617